MNINRIMHAYCFFAALCVCAMAALFSASQPGPRIQRYAIEEIVPAPETHMAVAVPLSVPTAPCAGPSPCVISTTAATTLTTTSSTTSMICSQSPMVTIYQVGR